MNKQLKCIAVDLTPVLPGGENGGAKIFVLALLATLAETAPDIRFLLLTHSRTHDELATLDRSNMRRMMIIDAQAAHSPRRTLRDAGIRILRHLPARLRSAVMSVRYRVKRARKRDESGSLLHGMGVDLLFCPFTAPTYFEPGIPTVCTIYDLQYKTYPQFFSPEDVAHREHTLREAYRLATALTAISDYSRESAIAHGNLDPGRIRTIYLRLGRHIPTDRPGDHAILGSLGLYPQKYLLYPANFWKHKNHEMLLTAFGIACQEGLDADVKLVCTGAPGARRQFLTAAADAMNLRDRIIFPGFPPDAVLSALMANSAGLVFPSLYEGFGLPLIEAMSMRIPVACSNMTSLPEVAGGAAILFDPRVPMQIAAALISLTQNDSLRARLTERGVQRASEFSDTKRMAAEYLQLFRESVASESGKNRLIGAYADGWAGSNLRIQITPAANARTLEVEFCAPDWLPQSSLTIRARRGGASQGSEIVIERGKNAVMSLPVDADGGRYEITISPTFVPAHFGLGSDQRELSVLLQRCRIVLSDRKIIELFSDKTSA